MTLFFTGLFIRIYISNLGYNFDFGSWQIVGNLVNQGKNVYQETTRYSYGPLWFLILGLFKKISLLFENDYFAFRCLIILTLTISDFLVSLLVSRFFGSLAFFFIFFNPILIYTSGFHNQFDTLAIFFGLLALITIEKKREKIVGYLLLGLSLIIKHIFLFFPLWLIIRTKNKKQFLYSLVPYLIFISSFLPFINSKETFGAILNNVFLNKRDLLYPFLQNTSLTTPIILFIVLWIFGWVFKKEKIFYSGLYYLLIFTGSLVNSGAQYLSIPLIGFLFFPLMGLFYTLVAAFYLYFHLFNLNLILIICFNLCWLVIITKKIIFLSKLMNRLISFLLVVSLIFSFKFFIKYTKEYFFYFKNNFYFLTIYRSPLKLFKKENFETSFDRNNTIIGNSIIKENNLGLIYIPYFLDNQPEDFFEKNYQIEVKFFINDRLYHQEKRSIGNALTENGIIFGMPVLKEGKNKNYKIILKNNLPTGKKYFYLGKQIPYQEIYFIEKKQLSSPQFFINFIEDKAYFLFYDKKSVNYLIFWYFYIWLGVNLFIISFLKNNVKAYKSS